MRDFHPDPTPPGGGRPLIAEGDILTLGRNAAFTLEVVAVRGDRAWVRDLDDGRDGVIDLTSFRRFGFETPEILQ